MSELKRQLCDLVKSKGLHRLTEPVRLASGELSTDFVDVKEALAHGDDLALACRVILDALARRKVDFEAVGGLTMGADCFAHGVAILGSKRWFVVRKAPKGRGTNKIVEGTTLTARTRVVLVEDTVTTGGSIQQAYNAIEEAGAVVVAAVALVDRGDSAAEFFTKRSVPYIALLTYHDLGIATVGLSDS